MNVEVDYRQLQNESDYFLGRVEKGEIFVITQDGKPVAVLRPHQVGKARQPASDEVE